MREWFHFLDPAWLWMLVPLALLLGVLWRGDQGDSPWRRVISAPLQALLLGEAHRPAGRGALTLLALGWLIATLALAGPAWERKPQPVYQSDSALVIVLDLSSSMLAEDLQPSRLLRARFKVEDLLSRSGEGQTGLVVFAGDAFAVTPLTRDVATLSAQLKALDPSIMPVQGSRADLGLDKAGELLAQAGLRQGQILLLADGVQGELARQAAARLHRQGYTVSVLGVGTSDGAPLATSGGALLRDADGHAIVARLDSEALAAVARAGAGRYAAVRADAGDIEALLSNSPAAARRSPDSSRSAPQAGADSWVNRGPWLAVLLLPLAALAFRRGWLLSLPLATVLAVAPPPADAASWSGLWQRQEQQAAAALAEHQYPRAAELAREPQRRGSALYRQGDYAAAVEAFSRAEGADADYNRGNALAQLGRYQEAISAYEQALQAQPAMDDARANKAAIEALLGQQQKDSDKAQPQAGAAPPGQPANAQPNAGDAGEQQQAQGDAQHQPKAQSPSRATSAPQDDARPRDKHGDTPASSAGNAARSAPDSASGNQPQPASASPDASHSAPAPSHNAQQEPAASQQPGAADTRAVTQATQAQTPDGQSANGFQQAVDDLQRNRDDAARDAAEVPAQAAIQTGSGDRKPPAGSAEQDAHALDSEEKLAAEQWLRRIPDDPGALLRRKFLYQYQQRARHPDSAAVQPW